MKTIWVKKTHTGYNTYLVLNGVTCGMAAAGSRTDAILSLMAQPGVSEFIQDRISYQQYLVLQRYHRRTA